MNLYELCVILYFDIRTTLYISLFIASSIASWNTKLCYGNR